MTVMGSVFYVDVRKPKFHYADFATKSETSSRQSRELVADTNHVADFHDLCPRLSRGEVSVKVGVMEFGLYETRDAFYLCELQTVSTLQTLWRNAGRQNRS